LADWNKPRRSTWAKLCNRRENAFPFKGFPQLSAKYSQSVETPISQRQNRRPSPTIGVAVMSEDKGCENLDGAPQPTSHERTWAIEIAKLIVEMVQKHEGSQEEIESQVARELYCSLANMRDGN
jgi:hypothetical protein